MNARPSFRLLPLALAAILAAAGAPAAAAQVPAPEEVGDPSGPPPPPPIPAEALTAAPWVPASAAASTPAQPAPTRLSEPVAPSRIPLATAFEIPNPDERVDQLVLRDDSIDQVLALLERLTGRFIIRPQVLATPTITFNGNRPMTKREVVDALLSLLTINGIGVVPMGERFLKVVPLQQVRMEAPELVAGSLLGEPPSGRVLSKLFSPGFLRIAELQPLILPLLNQTAAVIVPIERANTLIVTDTVANLQRVEALLAQIDQPTEFPVRPRFYPVRFAKASDIVNQIRTISSGPLQQLLSMSTTINADDRTNQIIIVADVRQFPFFDDLVAKLDVQADPNTRNEVLFLKNADAKEVASLLTQLVTGQNRTGSERPTGQVQPTPAGPPTPGGAAPPTGAPGAVAGGPGGDNASSQFSKLLTILPDGRTNAIVVSGTVDDIRLIRQLVEKIDVVLAQVRIEVVIAEVTLNDEVRFGLDAFSFRYEGDRFREIGVSGSGFSGPNGALSLLLPNGRLGDLTLNAIVNNSGNRANVQILSNPTLLTTHNKEGRIFVGESQPIVSNFQSSVTGTTDGNTGTTSGITGSVQYRDAGIDLTVKPLIGSDGSIQLEINQKIDAFGPRVDLGGGLGSQPPINRREAKSFVNVADGEIVILGGLQSKTKDQSRNRLGPIPFLSDLLGSRRWSDRTTELMIFIRPAILRGLDQTTPDALRAAERLPQPEEVIRQIDPSRVPADSPSRGNLRSPRKR